MGLKARKPKQKEACALLALGMPLVLRSQIVVWKTKEKS